MAALERAPVVELGAVAERSLPHWAGTSEAVVMSPMAKARKAPDHSRRLLSRRGAREDLAALRKAAGPLCLAPKPKRRRLSSLDRRLALRSNEHMDVSYGRDEQLLRFVQSNGYVSIETLSVAFDLSPQSIRRLVNRLADQGKLKRSHGGVSPPTEGGNLEYRTRQVLHLAEKKLVAAAVARFVPDGASLFIGLGTTPECVAVALADHRDLRVFTNSLNVAAALSANPAIEIAIAGGLLRRRDRDVIGSGAVSFFRRYKVDFSIFGVGGVDPDGMLLDFDEGEVEAREAMVEGSRCSLLVADHTKFGRSVPVRGGKIGEVDHLFTDRLPPAEFMPAIRKGDVQVHHPPDDRVTAA